MLKSIHFFGRICLGTAVAASGLMQVVNGALVRVIPDLPGWIPSHALCATVIGVVLLVIGAALIANIRLHAAALVLGGLILATFLLQRVPEIAANPGAGFIWTNPAKLLALLGGAMVLFATSQNRPTRRQFACGRLAPVLLAVFLLICGVQHFVYAGFVDSLVPVWIPPSQRFWTDFSGLALLAGGMGLLLPRTRRVAGLLSGLMIFLWILLLHIPRSLELKSAFELAGCFEALALVGTAWLIAANAAGVSPSPAPAGIPPVAAS